MHDSDGDDSIERGEMDDECIAYDARGVGIDAAGDISGVRTGAGNDGHDTAGAARSLSDGLMLLVAVRIVMMLVGIMAMVRMAVSVSEAVVMEVVMVMGNSRTAVMLEQKLRQVVMQKVTVPCSIREQSYS